MRNDNNIKKLLKIKAETIRTLKLLVSQLGSSAENVPNQVIIIFKTI